MEQFKGKVWVLGDDIDTDIIIPTEYLALPTVEDMKQYGFSPLRPELAGQIGEGDIIVAGSIFFWGNVCDNGNTQIGCDLPLLSAFFTHGCFFPCKNRTHIFSLQIKKSCNGESISTIISTSAHNKTVIQTDSFLLHHFHCFQSCPLHQYQRRNPDLLNRIFIRSLHPRSVW